MPDMTPVANTIIPPNPQQGMNTLSGILGLQQQRQALQTGQYLQKSAAARAQSDLLATQGQQESADFFKNWDPADHVGAAGTIDLNSALSSDLFKQAGPGKTPIMESLLGVKQKQLAAKQTLAGLNGTLINQLGTQIGALAQDPDIAADKTDPRTGVNTGRAKIDQYFSNFAKLSPDAARVAQIYQPMIDHIPPGKLPQAIQQLQMQAQDVGGQQAQQNPQPGSVDTGGAIYPTVTARSSGIPQFTGQRFDKSMAPHQVTNAAGQIVNVAPSGALTPAPSAGSSGASGGANPTTAQATVQNTAATGISQRVQQAQSAANNTIQAQDALSRARTLLDNPSLETGKGFDTGRTLSNAMASLGIDTQGATDANTLVKNLARYEAARATQAGLGGTDAARELAHNGSPNTTVDQAALKGMVTQSLATEKALAAYARIQAKTSDGQSLARNEADFRNIPNLIEGYEYGLARSPKEAEEFLTKHGISAQQMA